MRLRSLLTALVLAQVAVAKLQILPRQDLSILPIDPGTGSETSGGDTPTTEEPTTGPTSGGEEPTTGGDPTTGGGGSEPTSGQVSSPTTTPQESTTAEESSNTSNAESTYVSSRVITEGGTNTITEVTTITGSAAPEDSAAQESSDDGGGGGGLSKGAQLAIIISCSVAGGGILIGILIFAFVRWNRRRKLQFDPQADEIKWPEPATDGDRPQFLQEVRETNQYGVDGEDDAPPGPSNTSHGGSEPPSNLSHQPLNAGPAYDYDYAAPPPNGHQQPGQDYFYPQYDQQYGPPPTSTPAPYDPQYPHQAYDSPYHYTTNSYQR